ncbi:MAG: GGDEF domain-containing response regulator [Thermodesulfobacteriota bacterium]
MRVLIAEDDPISLLKLESMLRRWGYETVSCPDGLAAWEIIHSPECPPLLILDWEMPGMDGPTLCRKARELEREPYLYILILTARDAKDDVVLGMEAGADDYITKPYYPHELEVRVRAGRRIAELNHELLAARNALKLQATHDSLTGLFNRPAILEHLEAELARSLRQQGAVCLGLMDIDHFKQINDTHGHQVGDQVLQEVARRLERAIRPYDRVGRYGGEEFLIIMSNCDCVQLEKHYERLRACLADIPVETSAGRLTVTGSFGVGILPIKKFRDANDLIRLADQALYRAKAGGRNRIEVNDG